MTDLIELGGNPFIAIENRGTVQAPDLMIYVASTALNDPLVHTPREDLDPVERATQDGHMLLLANTLEELLKVIRDRLSNA